jgi:hypothetical protein
MASLVKIDGPVIAASETISSAIDCSNGSPVLVMMPTDWTPADLTFQVSHDGVAYSYLFDTVGGEVTVDVVPGTSVRIPNDVANGARFLRFHSGRKDEPRPQAEQRMFTTIIDKAVTVVAEQQPA